MDKLGNSQLLKSKNPLIVFISFFFTFGFYFFQWGSYVVNNLNYINRKDLFNVARIKKIVLIFFVVFISIFILLAFIGPVSFNKSEEVTQNLLTILFFIGFTMAITWFIALFYFFGYTNYKIDKLISTNRNIYTKPWLSTIISVLLVPLLLSPLYTQIKLNKLISLFKEHNQIIESKTAVNKKIDIKKSFISLIVFTLLIGVVIYLAVIHFSEWGRWESEIRPYADDFLERLIEEDYEGIYSEYGTDSPMNLEEFVQKLENFRSNFGKVNSYEFKTSTKSSQSGELTSFYIYYLIELNSDKKYQADFSVEINRKLNIPYKNRLELFEIHNQGKTILYLPLIRPNE